MINGFARKATIILPIFLTLGLLSLTGRAQLPEKLNLLQAYAINGPVNLQPSGLASCNGHLLMVSDKHDDSIFAMTTEGDQAYAKLAFALNSISEPPSIDLPLWQRIQRRANGLLGKSGLDWEGITCDEENLFLLSEEAVGIFRVNKRGDGAWLQTNLYDAAKQAGLLTKYNAFVEGIARSENGFIIAAERQPRGLMTITEEAGAIDIQQITVVESSNLPSVSSQARADDFTGVYIENGKLFTLERNASAVCRRAIDSYTVEYCWSYAEVENSDAYRYLDTRYGMAEGITVFGGALYIVFDNNERFRYTGPTDKRSQLFKFQLPTDWQQ